MSWQGFNADSFRSRGRGVSTGLLHRAGGTGRGSSLFLPGHIRGSGGLTDYDGLLHPASRVTEGGSETPRVAIIGTGSSVFQQWWAIHAGGFRVSTVVGTDDAKVSHSSNVLKGTTVAAAVSDADKKASAEAARVAAARCVEFYRLPEVRGSVTTREDPSVAEVRVCASDGLAGEEPKAISATGAVTTSFAMSNARVSSVPTEEKDCVIATSWSLFFKPFLDTQGVASDMSGDRSRSPSPSPIAKPTNTGLGSWRPGATRTTPTPMVSGSPAKYLVDDVEVVYLVDYGADCDEAGLCVVLMWLLERDKQIVVDCALSAETLATCAAAAAGSIRGQPEMKRLFLYRGGGCRRGWSVTAVAQLREVLGVRRVTGRSSGKGSVVASNPAQTLLARNSNVFTKVSTKTAAPAFDGDGGFSVFDLMGSALGSALQDAESSAGGVSRQALSAPEKSSGSATASTPATATPNVPGSRAEEEAKPGAGTPVPTSIALDPAASVIGAVRHISMVAVSPGGPLPAGSAAVASLGIMGTLGWDAVAVVLHLLDWTCPDMIVGRVLRRTSDTHQPLCVQAEMYYGIQGTAGESDGTGESVARRTAPVRPPYLSISLHIATPGGSGSSGTTTLYSTDEDQNYSGVFQQSLRIVGTTAVLTVDSPLLPTASASHTVAAPPTTTTASSPPQASPAASIAALSGTAAAPTAPKVSHSYRLATQDVSIASGQRERCVRHVTVGNAESCAEFRVWQHVRSQLSVSATAATLSGGVGLGASSPYGLRYANRGGAVGFGAGYGSYGRGRGMQRGGAAPATASGPSVTAQVVAAGSAAQDVQRAWLVQKVVEGILTSASRLAS
ncbi:hypothetical protein JKF63_04841 [Porcisia hertigi]|uniref:Uncharacterized protein n=1 Tax=Porcisia hertigi TaxID=2761500 RepID=A0A836IHF2_9TRYP|nr:hypothetical protein JKF63_04841 [Porcisia hertigi]